MMHRSSQQGWCTCETHGKYWAKNGHSIQLAIGCDVVCCVCSYVLMWSTVGVCVGLAREAVYLWLSYKMCSCTMIVVKFEMMFCDTQFCDTQLPFSEICFICCGQYATISYIHKWYRPVAWRQHVYHSKRSFSGGKKLSVNDLLL